MLLKTEKYINYMQMKNMLFKKPEIQNTLETWSKHVCNPHKNYVVDTLPKYSYHREVSYH